jgi:hypothetical protein
VFERAIRMQPWTNPSDSPWKAAWAAAWSPIWLSGQAWTEAMGRYWAAALQHPQSALLAEPGRQMLRFWTGAALLGTAPPAARPVPSTRPEASPAAMPALSVPEAATLPPQLPPASSKRRPAVPASKTAQAANGHAARPASRRKPADLSTGKA